MGLTSEEISDATLEESKVDFLEISKVMESTDVRKSLGLNGISNWMIRRDAENSL